MSSVEAPDLTSSGPWSIGWPSLTSANPQAITFMSLASAVYKSGAPMLYDPDLARRRDPSVWDKIMLDDDARPAWLQRVAKVVRREWSLIPGDESPEASTKARYIEALLKDGKGLYEARRHLEHASMWGYAPIWTSGNRTWRAPCGVLGEWWAPTLFETLDPRQIALNATVITDGGAEGGDKVTITPIMATVANGTHRPIASPECLALHVWCNDTLDRKGYGRGLDEPVYVLVWLKQMVRTIMLQGYEKWANGIADVAVDASAHADTDQDSAAVAEEHANAVASMRALGYYIHDKRDELTVVTSNGSGSQTGIDLLKMLGEGITRIILNSVLPSGQASGAGSLARAGEEGKTTDDVMDAERDLLDNIVTERIVGLIDSLNLPMWAQLGVAGAPAPKFSSVADEHEDPEKFGRIVEMAQRAGLAISEEEAYRRFGLSKPAAGEPVLAPPAPTISGGFGGGFGGGDPFGAPPARGDAPAAADAKTKDGEDKPETPDAPDTPEPAAPAPGASS